MLNDILDLVKKKAEEEACFDKDDFTADGYSGGNFDDAYSIGCSDGEISFARELLALLEDGV